MSNSSIWNPLGIFGETYRSNLLFDPFSKSLVAHFHRPLRGEGYGVESLYARHIADEKYHRITEETDTLSFEEPRLSSVGPHLFVKVMEIAVDDDRFPTYTWNSIRKIDLMNAEVVSCIEAKDLPIDEPYHRGWVSDLYGIAPDGETIYCNLGLEKGTGEVDYWVAEISLSDKTFEIIARLNSCLM